MNTSYNGSLDTKPCSHLTPTQLLEAFDNGELLEHLETCEECMLIRRQYLWLEHGFEHRNDAPLKATPVVQKIDSNVASYNINKHLSIKSSIPDKETNEANKDTQAFVTAGSFGASFRQVLGGVSKTRLASKAIFGKIVACASVVAMVGAFFPPFGQATPQVAIAESITTTPIFGDNTDTTSSSINEPETPSIHTVDKNRPQSKIVSGRNAGDDQVATPRGL